MKPIRWRKDRATVEGVKMVRCMWNDKHVRIDTLGAGIASYISVRPANQQQIDAAAYALADLVATLRGME